MFEYIKNNVNVRIIPAAITIDDTLTISGAAADAKVVGDQLGELDASVLRDRRILTSEDDIHDLDQPGVYEIRKGSGSQYNIPANFPFVVETNKQVFRLIVVKPKTESSHEGECHFVVGETSLFFEKYLGDAWSEWSRIRDPEHYVYAQCKSLGLHVVLDDTENNRGRLNAIRRARQLSDVTWTAKSDIPRAFLETRDLGEEHGPAYFGKFAADTEYQGIPYTGDHYIGIEFPLEVFMSSLCSKDSAIYQENRGSSSQDNPCYYGSNCTGLTGYALNLPEIYSNYWPNVKGLSKRGTIKHDGTGLDLSAIRLADILQINGHCALVTDLVIENGVVTHVEVTEAARTGNLNRDDLSGPKGGKGRRTLFTADQFSAEFDNYSVYVYSYIGKVPYVPTPYSPMPDEGIPYAKTSFSCLPYEGNLASYSQSGTRLVKILINSSGYTHLQVFKNGSSFNEYALSSDPYVEVQCDAEESVYTARLVKKQNGEIVWATSSCEWYIRPNISPTISVSDNKINIVWTCKKDQYRPWYTCLGTSVNNTSTNVIHGESIPVFDYQTSDNQDGTVTYTFDVDYPDTSKTYIRIGIQSDKYGSASSSMKIS